MVFVLNKHKKPLMPCPEKRGRAVIHKIAPFTIRLKDRTADESAFQPLRAKFDPGSKTTGVAVILEGAKGPQIIFLGEIVHKADVKARMDKRRGRRHRKTRYRKPRFQNRKRKEGWLPPSLEARIDQTLHALATIRITDLSVEHVRFDTQKLEIFGVEYQQGTLLVYEVREYLLKKWARTCVYCAAAGVSLQVEHIVTKSPGGSNRVSNLALACEPCNLTKNNRAAAEFGHLDIQAQARKPLKNAAIMNATRWRLYEQLKATGLPVKGGPGSRTERLGYGSSEEHRFDALCVGESTPEHFIHLPATVQMWTAQGRGARQMCGADKDGFPIRHRSRQKVHFGFQTGDLIRAVVPKGKYAGTWTVRVLVRANGSFDISVQGRRIAQGDFVQILSHCAQRNGGWTYEQNPVSA